MVDLVDRAQELEEIQRQEAIRRVLERRARPIDDKETSPPQEEKDDT